MLINLTTLDVVECPSQVVQSWSPELNLWVCIVEQKMNPPPAGVLELTAYDLQHIADLRSQGMNREQALQAIGVQLGHSNARV